VKCPDLPQKVSEYIAAHNLLRTGDTVLAGVSGGPDSVALLLVLCALRAEWGTKVLAAHVDHQLRRDSARDARFVTRLCANLHVPLFIRKVKIAKSKGKSSIEEIARELRLKMLTVLAKQCRADAVALGHHQDDLAETVLMRILRGSGLEGLAAILPEKEIYGQKFIRPFLGVSRREICAFLKSEKTGFRTDPTNRSTDFFRNKIRLRLLPLFEREYQPQIKILLAQLAQNAANDYAFLDQQAKKYYRFCIAGTDKNSVRLSVRKVAGLHPSLRHSILRNAVAQIQGDKRRITCRHVQEIDRLLTGTAAVGRVDLPAGISATKSESVIRLRRRNPC